MTTSRKDSHSPGTLPVLGLNSASKKLIYPGPGKQHGATLIVGLVMLVVLTLLVLSAIRSSTTNMRIAGNMQMQEEATAATQKAIEDVISNNNFLTAPPAAQGVDINGDGATDYTVTFNPAPACTSAYPVTKADSGVPPECLGSSGSTYCYWTTWDVAGTVTDPNSGALTQVHQGVRVVAGVDSALTYCGV